MLQRPAQHAEEQQSVEIAPFALAFEGADVNETQHAGQDQRVAQRRQFRELPRQQEAQPRAQHIRDRDAPHHGIGDVEISWSPCRGRARARGSGRRPAGSPCPRRRARRTPRSAPARRLRANWSRFRPRSRRAHRRCRRFAARPFRCAAHGHRTANRSPPRRCPGSFP